MAGECKKFTDLTIGQFLTRWDFATERLKSQNLLHFLIFCIIYHYMNPKIAQEIQEQQDHGRQKYGGHKDNFSHDDLHSLSEWCGFIYNHNELARYSTPMECRQHLIKVATLAVSAVEAFDRKIRFYNHDPAQSCPPMKTYQTKPIAVQAFFVDDELLLSNLIDKKPLPFGLNASGHYRPDERKLYSGSIAVKELYGFARAYTGNWIVQKDAGNFKDYEVLTDQQFHEKYE